MTSTYRVLAAESLDQISAEDFFRPRKKVTLLRMENGEILRVLLPMRRSLRAGDVIRLDDHEVDRILVQPRLVAGLSTEKQD
jgi:hypothetical protein